MTTRTQKIKARSAVYLALAKGSLKRPTRCTNCDKAKKLHAHHNDYTMLLDVEWLCAKCHMALHAARRSPVVPLDILHSKHNNLPGRIAGARKVLGMTQVQLAQRLGVSPQAVTQWESGAREPRGVDALVRLAEALGCTLDWLCAGSEAHE